MIRATYLLVLAGLVACPGSRAGTVLAYVANINSDSISVVDVDAQQLIDTISLGPGAGPVDVVVSTDQRFIYVSRVDGTIQKRWRPSGALVTSISVGLHAQELLLSMDDGRVYVAGHDGTSGAVIVLAAGNLTVLDAVPLPGSGFGLAFSPDGSRLYASSPSADSLTVIDSASATVIDTIAVGNTPQGVAVAADGARVYAGTMDSMGVASLSVVDVAGATLVQEIVFGSAPLTIPFFIALSPTRAYVTVGHVSPGPFEALGVIDLAAGNALPGRDLGGAQAGGIEWLEDGRLLIATGGGVNRLLIYDALSLTPLGGVDVGLSPRGLAVIDVDRIFANGFGY